MPTVRFFSIASSFTYIYFTFLGIIERILGPAVQSVVSLTSSLRVIPLTVLADSIYNILIFLLKNVSSLAKATHIVSANKNQHICVSLDVNFNESLTNDIVSFEQPGPGILGN